jgi:hypothetical protein
MAPTKAAEVAHAGTAKPVVSTLPVVVGADTEVDEWPAEHAAMAAAPARRRAEESAVRRRWSIVVVLIFRALGYVSPLS